MWKCWGGPSRSKINRRQIIRSQKGVFYLDTHTGQRFRIDRRGDLLDEKGQPIGAGQTWLALKAFPRPVETEDDILEFLGPTPPPEFWIEDGFLSNLEYLLPRYGQSHFLMFPLNTIFADALDLFGGFEEGLIALSTKRELFHKALEAIVDRPTSAPVKARRPRRRDVICMARIVACRRRALVARRPSGVPVVRLCLSRVYASRPYAGAIGQRRPPMRTDRQWQTRREAGTQSHGPLAGSRVAELEVDRCRSETPIEHGTPRSGP